MRLSKLWSGNISTAPRWTYEQTLKDPTVEEPINRHFHRRVAFQLIRPLQNRTSLISPNQITMISGILGTASATTYYYAGERGAAFWFLGSLLLFGSVIFDCADGMLARLTGQGSRFGMLLDGAVDFTVGFFVWFGVSHSAVPMLHSVWSWPVSVAVLASIVVHVGLYDQIKNRFVQLCTPPGAPPSSIAPPSGEREVSWLERVFEKIYSNLHQAIGRAATKEVSSPSTAEYAAANRVALTPAMRLATHLGLGTHLAIMYVAAALTPFFPGAPIYVGLVVIAIGLNVVMAVMLKQWNHALKNAVRT